MFISILQTAPCDVAAQLKRVATKLPREIIDRTDFTVISDISPDELPTFVAQIEDATEEEVAQIQAAIAAVDPTGLTVSLSNALVSAPPEESEPEDPYAILEDAAFMGTAAGPMTLGADQAQEFADDIKDLIEAKASGTPFPELGWEGKQKIAYDHIVSKLGVAPMDDQGDTLPIGCVKDLTRPRRVPPKAWNEVVAQLETELLFYTYLTRWFGDGGHLRNMFRDQIVIDYGFVDTMNTTFKLTKDNTTVKILLDLAMGTAVGLIKGIPPYGTVVGSVVAAIWALSKPNWPNPNGEVKGKIKDVRNGISTTFLASINVVEGAHAKIASDWGLLEKFGLMIKDKSLVWPKEMGAIRAANSRAFQYEAIRVILNHKAATTAPYHHFGIARIGKSSKKARKRKWKPASGDYHLYSASKKDSNTNVYWDYFLGSMSCSYVTMAGLVCDTPKASPKALQKKLFGTDTADQSNPDLNIPGDFLDDPKSKARKGWVFDDFRRV